MGGFGTQSYTVTIAPPVAITTASPLTGGVINEPYSQTFAATGGNGLYTNWHFAAGSAAPPGLTLTTAGVLSGTPTAMGAYTFTVVVNDTFGGGGFQTFKLVIGDLNGAYAMQNWSASASTG